MLPKPETFSSKWIFSSTSEFTAVDGQQLVLPPGESCRPYLQPPVHGRRPSTHSPGVLALACVHLAAGRSPMDRLSPGRWTNQTSGADLETLIPYGSLAAVNPSTLTLSSLLITPSSAAAHLGVGWLWWTTSDRQRASFYGIPSLASKYRSPACARSCRYS